MIPSVTNLVLDVVLIKFFDLGMHGAAWATTASYLFCFLFILWFFLSKNSELQVRMKHFFLNLVIVKEIAALGFVTLSRQAVVSITYLLMNNILFGNEISEKDVINMLEKYELDVVYDGLEQGVYTSAGVKGSGLSMGMQKVTLLMRGIFKQGKIIIFDEPLSGLDKNTGNKVVNMIMKECSDKTVIIISHTNEFNARVNRVIQFGDNNDNEDKDRDEK